jgi:lipopolysaccharide export system protein LptC
MFRSRGAFTVASLLLLAVLAWWIADERPALQPVPLERPDDQSDYYLRNFTMMTSGDDGLWNYRLEAQRMLHFPKTEHWEFEAPRLEFYTEQGANWYGEAERGRAWAAGDEILLQGEVHLWRPGSEVNVETRLETSEVHLHTQQRYAQTEAHAVLRQPAGRIEGIGAHAWLDEQRVELQSKVRGFYEPQAR